MARGRFLSRSVAVSAQLGAVSLAADFLFRALLPFADAAGRMRADPLFVKSQCVPLRPEITAEDVPRLLGELAGARDHDGVALLELYAVNGAHFLTFPRFADHQTGLRIDREAPSRIPAPPGAIDRAEPMAPQPVAASPSLETVNSGVTPDLLPHKRSEGEVEVEDKRSEEGHAFAALESLACLRDRFVATFYGNATEARRAGVVRQLDELLTPAGVRVQGATRATATPATLERALVAVLERPPRKSDAAVWVLLQKCREGECNAVPAPGFLEGQTWKAPTRGSRDGGGVASLGAVLTAATPREAAQVSPAAPARLEVPRRAAATEAPTAATVAAALAWLNDSAPGARQRLETEVDAGMVADVHPKWADMPRFAGVRARRFDEAAVHAYLTAGAEVRA